MKKVLLTGALLLTFAFSYASSEVSKKETIEVQTTTSAETAVVVKPAVKPAIMMECFGLCCGITVCFGDSDCGDCSTPENIEDTFNDLEEEHCC